MTRSEMFKKEATPKLENPIRYEYTGNYSSLIHIKPDLAIELAAIVGARRPLIIKDGSERVARIEAKVHMQSDQEIYDYKEEQDKPPSTFRLEDDAVVLLINSQVIDSRIRDKQYYSADIDYETSFIICLRHIILSGISLWALRELKEQSKKPLILNKNWWKLKVFMKDKDILAVAASSGSLASTGFPSQKTPL